MTKKDLEKTEAITEDIIDYHGLGTILIDKVGDVRTVWLNDDRKELEDAIKENVKNTEEEFEKELKYYGKHYFVATISVLANYTKGTINVNQMKLNPIKVFGDNDEELRLELALDTKPISEFDEKELFLLKKLMYEDYLPEDVVKE